ncbi:MAG TPA: thioredoxin domain-containing protein [bacterium]|nr:thioredoxin domain-containing protein [bacterium]
MAVLPACGPSPAQLEKAVGDYIQKNPQALQKPIQDAMKANRPQRAPELPLAERIKKAIQVPIDKAPVKGPANAPITIVEFSEFQCPFCKRVLPTVDQVMKEYDGKVKIAFRHNPLPFHKDAMPAAKDQGKFWEMHDALFATQQDLSEPAILKAAQSVGLDMKKFEADFKSTKYDAVIQEDMEFAKSNGATGTPAFFINGVMIKGAQPFPSFKVVIDGLLNPASIPAAAPAASPAAK